MGNFFLQTWLLTIDFIHRGARCMRHGISYDTFINDTQTFPGGCFWLLLWRLRILVFLAFQMTYFVVGSQISGIR